MQMKEGAVISTRIAELTEKGLALFPVPTLIVAGAPSKTLLENKDVFGVASIPSRIKLGTSIARRSCAGFSLGQDQ